MGVPRYLSYKYLGRYVHPSLTLICRQQAKSLLTTDFGVPSATPFYPAYSAASKTP